MKMIVYISNSRIPTEKAYGVSIAKTCEALALRGVQVLLLAPRVRNTSGNDIFSYYDIKKNFSVRYIPTLDAVKWGWRYGFVWNQISFGIVVFLLYIFRKRDFVVVTRDEVSGFLLRIFGIPVYYDMHGFPERFILLWRILLKPLSGIITTNDWKVEQCHSNLRISKEKMIVARNGFDPELFEVPKSQEVLRRRMNMPSNKPIVLYTGHLHDWKGVYVLADAARLMPEVNFIFVGGTYYHIQDFKKRYQDISNIILVGHKPHVDIPFYLKAADILALPNSGSTLKDPRFSLYTRHDTSPIKMFEYMASGVPIVASDLPSIREILNNKNAVLVKPDSPEDLKRGIETVLRDKNLAMAVSKQALEDVKEYTWEKRAGKIIDFINKKSG
ncbi:MAG: glycosyltransferase family 4 protein [bacterium]|nr:glycosyltransferase family 4 protein [bacterium]